MEYTVETDIIREQDPTNPREWSNLGTMACFHSRHNLGDEDHGLTPAQAREAAARRGTISLPVYLYDHGELVMSTTPFSCPFDSGQVGVIFATPEQIRYMFQVKRITAKVRERAFKALQQEVETYNQYLQGDVWCCEINIKDHAGEPFLEQTIGEIYGQEYAEQVMRDEIKAFFDKAIL